MAVPLLCTVRGTRALALLGGHDLVLRGLSSRELIYFGHLGQQVDLLIIIIRQPSPHPQLHPPDEMYFLFSKLLKLAI